MSVWVLCSRLLLIMSLWQTPLPRVDYHCAAPQTAEEFEHFAKFHTAADLRDCNLSWHVHFVWAQRPENPAPSKAPSSDGTGEDGPQLCSLDSSLKCSRQFEPGEMAVASFVQPVETGWSAYSVHRQHLADRGRRLHPAAQDICTCLCTRQC